MKQIATLFLFLIALGSGKAQLIINEVMQSNIDCIMDDQNEFPDSWVELYNNSDQDIQLGSYMLSDKRDGHNAWTLPNQTLGARQFVLVYCDKSATGFHTSFRIDTGNDSHISLLTTGGSVVDSLTIQKQPDPNISYGRLTDGANQWGYQYTPTPNAANCGTICTEILGDPIFSVEGQVFSTSQSFSLTLTVPEGSPEGTEIRYTYDGSEPTLYSTPYVSDISINSTRTIRAKLFCPGYLSPRAVTHSYIFHGRDVTLPVISIVTNSKYFDDSKIGIYVNGSYDRNKKNYEHNWRRPINIEIFAEPGQESDINQLCETRIAGAASRGCQMKSLAIYANKRFGKKHFKYEFFPDQRPEQKNFNSLVLRNAGNDFDYLYMRDAICQRSMSTYADLDWQAWRPAIVYINGKYKGMLNIRERGNESNIYTNYDGLEDIDLIENWWDLKEGTMDNWNDFKAFYNEKGHTWEEYDERMDLNEFINLMIMDMYFNNYDFPGNNIVMWRPREEGGRWRFIAKDVDFTMGLYGDKSSFKIFEWYYNPNYDWSHNWANKKEHTLLFRQLMEDSTFKRRFIDHFAVYMGDFLNYDNIWDNVWEPMYDAIKTEYPNHRKLVNEWWPNYNDELTSGKNWIKNRTDNMYKQISDYYNYGVPTKLTINNQLSAEDCADIQVIFNEVPLSQGTFNGKYFGGQTITLQGGPKLDAEGQPTSTKDVYSWIVTTQTSTGTTTQQFEGNTCTFTMPGSVKEVSITANLDPNALEHIASDRITNAPIYTLDGRLVGNDLDALPAGIYLRDGQKVMVK